MIRQFLWGQRFTRKHFNYTSNCFWLPDTFGYSAAIPQIMKGCAVDYFLTTKISWNDTNKFPIDTFYWQGLDGTKVFTHFNTTHHYPDVEAAHHRIDGECGIKQKTVTSKRYLAYGFGDGGGGPQFEMVELARRCKDLDGCPKMEHKFVGGKVIVEDKLGNKIADVNLTAGWKDDKGEWTSETEALRGELYAINGVSNDVAVALKFIDKGEAVIYIKDKRNVIFLCKHHCLKCGFS